MTTDFDGILRLLAHLVRLMGGAIVIPPEEYTQVFLAPAPNLEIFKDQATGAFILKVVD